MPKKSPKPPVGHGKKKNVQVVPDIFRLCYPNYQESQKRLTIKQMYTIAKNRKNKPKRDPRYIAPKKPKTGIT